MYAIVEFMARSGYSSGELEIIPIAWLVKNEYKCYWPKTNKPDFVEAMVKTTTIYKTTWLCYKIFKIHKKLATYEEAQKQLTTLLDNASDMSELSSATINSFVRKRQLDYSFSSSDEEILEDINVPMDQDVTCTDVLNPVEVNQDMNQPSDPLSDTSLPNLTFSTLENYLPQIDHTQHEGRQTQDLTYLVNTQTYLTNTIAKIGVAMEQQTLLLNELVVDARKRREQTEVLISNIPKVSIMTLQDFEEFENRLKDTAFRKYMVRRLAAVGGNGVQSLTRRIMKYVLSNKVAIDFNWKGREKRSFEKTMLMSLIYDAAKLNYNGEENDFLVAKTVKEWLKYAKFRENAKK